MDHNCKPFLALQLTLTCLVFLYSWLFFYSFDEMLHEFENKHINKSSNSVEMINFPNMSTKLACYLYTGIILSKEGLNKAVFIPTIKGTR